MKRASALRALTAALAAVVAGLNFTTAIEVDQILVPMIVAAAAAAVIAWAATRLPSPVAVLLSLVALVAGAPLLVSLTTSGTDASMALDAVRDGWYQVVTSSVPAPTSPTATGLTVVAVWLATMISAELLIRAAMPAGALVPPILVVVLAFAVGPGGRAGSVVPVLAVVAALAIVLFVDAALRSAAGGVAAAEADGAPNADATAAPLLPGVPRLAAGVVLVAVVSLLGSVVGSVAPGADDDHPFTLRDEVTAPREDVELTNPLPLVARLRRDFTDAVLFRVRLDGRSPSNQLRLRTAVLTEYDGTRWLSADRFVPAGSELPDPADRVAAQRELRQVVTVEPALAEITGGGLLPLVGVAREVQGPEGARLAASPTTGSVVLSELRQDRTFRFEALVGVPDATSADYLAAAEAKPADPLVERPALPKVLESAATSALDKAFSPWDQLTQLQRWFSEQKMVVDVEEPISAGQSYRQLSSVLAAEPGTGSQEQYASLFALMAGSRGFSTRLAVGYQVPAPPAGETVAVTGGDAYAWPEVYLEDLGWVAFDPAPAPADEPEEEPEVDDPVETAAEQAEQAQEPARPPAPADDVDRTATEESTPLAKVLVPALVVAVPVLYLVALALLRRRRRSRARASDPGQQALAAWDETLDHLWLAGLPPTSTQTVTEVRRATEIDLDPTLGPPVDRLGRRAESVLFAGSDPVPAEADGGWADVDEIRSALLRRRPLLRRVLGVFDPRPLVGSRR